MTKKLVALACLLVLPAAAQQQYKIAVVSLIHAHVWLHLGTMLKGDKVKLVGVAETEPGLLERAKRVDVIPQTNNVTRPGVPEDLIFADWKKMIEETKPDFVWAFTETNRHVEVVEFCAPHGIHVMVEKPLAATYQEALKIQQAARKHKIQVLTNFGSTWNASTYAVKQAVDEGAIGKVFRLKATVGHNGPGDPRKSSFAAWLADPVQNGGGALVDFGCYSVLWSIWLKGKPESVFATALHMKPEMFPKVEDHATIILNYKDATAIFEASWDLPPRPPSGNELYGLSGSITASGRRIELRKPGGRPASGGRGGAESQEVPVTPLPPERSEPIAYMVHCLETKQTVDGLSSLDLNVAVNEVLDAAKLSIKTGRAVPLPLKP